VHLLGVIQILLGLSDLELGPEQNRLHKPW